MKHSVYLVAALAATPAAAIDNTQLSRDVSFDIEFRFHVDDNIAEQDVYVEGTGSADEVWRPGPDAKDANTPLFSSASPQAHAPTDPEALGPFPKGAALDLTLGEWLGASGSGTYHCTSGTGQLTLDFEGLVPGGVYTLWHFFMAKGATEPFIVTFDLPVGAFDGSQATFVADEHGSANFDQTFASCLQLTGEQLIAGLAVNWHSDGQTYGVKPGSFGQNAHIQLYTDLPAEADL